MGDEEYERAYRRVTRHVAGKDFKNKTVKSVGGDMVESQPEGLVTPHSARIIFKRFKPYNVKRDSPADENERN